MEAHDSQRVTFAEDGSADVHFRVDGLGEIAWWILGYGDQVQVIAPAALRKRIAGAANELSPLLAEDQGQNIPEPALMIGAAGAGVVCCAVGSALVLTVVITIAEIIVGAKHYTTECDQPLALLLQ